MSEELEATETRSPDAGKYKMANFDPIDLSSVSKVNMTNCYNHSKHFFRGCKSIHFNLLIAYWMMAGYLGPVDSVKKAYQKGHDILMELVYKEGMVESKDSEGNGNMIQIASSTDSKRNHCRHDGLCCFKDLELADFLELPELWEVTPTDGALKNQKGSLLIIDGNNLSYEVFRSCRRLKYLAYFNPIPDLLEPLLHNVKKPSVLLLRGCELLSDIYLPSGNFKTLTALEISGSGHLTSIPDKCFSELKKLRWLILRGCSKLVELPPLTYFPDIEVLDLSHCVSISSVEFERLPRLQYLNFSGLPIKKLLPKCFDGMQQLRWLILRGCSSLKTPISIRGLPNLEILDLSLCSRVPRISFQDLPQLGYLNLSGFSNANFPSNLFLNLVKLRFLILKSCSILYQFPDLRDLKNLEVLDLSHCVSLRHIESKEYKLRKLKMVDLSLTPLKKVPRIQCPRLTHLFLRESKLSLLDNLMHLGNLQVLDVSESKVMRVEELLKCKEFIVLDLSGTQITSADDVSQMANLRELILRRCRCLRNLPAMEKLESLKVFDISDCKLLTYLPDLSKLEELEVLDLSGTQIRCLPSFANPACLHRLSLRGLNLDSLESLASLSNLIELDLKGVKINSSPQLEVKFLQFLLKLQILDLSETSVKELSPMYKLNRMKELLLADCQHLNAVLDLQALTCLEKLDLSLSVPDTPTVKNCKEEIECDPQSGFSLTFPSSLRELVLTNRSGIQKLFPLATLGKLELLDVCGSDVTKIPYGMFARVKCIRLPSRVDLSGVQLGGIGSLQDAIVWNSDISQPSDIQIVSGVGSNVSLVAGAKSLFHLQKNQGSWEAFVHQFSVSHFPMGDDGVIHLDGDVFIFGDKNSQATELLNVEIKGISAEIHGLPEEIFNCNRDGIQGSLRRADNIALVGNGFSCRFSNLCTKALKVCCICECSNMKSVFSGKAPMFPERLILRHLDALISVCDKNVTPHSLHALKHFYIDSCPLLDMAIAPHVPENLETLQIKSCYKLRSLFKGNVSMSKLHELILSQLPELEDIAADLPSLKTLCISHCCKLKNLDRVIKSAGTSLAELRLVSCPMLQHIITSSCVPANLGVLELSSCTGLVTLFEDTDSSSRNIHLLSELHYLQLVVLLDLPNLRYVGGQISCKPELRLDDSIPAYIKQQLAQPKDRHAGNKLGTEDLEGEDEYYQDCCGEDEYYQDSWEEDEDYQDCRESFEQQSNRCSTTTTRTSRGVCFTVHDGSKRNKNKNKNKNKDLEGEDEYYQDCYGEDEYYQDCWEEDEDYQDCRENFEQQSNRCSATTTRTSRGVCFTVHDGSKRNKNKNKNKNKGVWWRTEQNKFYQDCWGEDEYYQDCWEEDEYYQDCWEEDEDYQDCRENFEQQSNRCSA